MQALDAQRSVFIELSLCLSPPSAVALVLRTICSSEALNDGTKWNSRSVQAGTAVYCYTMMLVLDLALYTLVCGLFINATLNQTYIEVQPSELSDSDYCDDRWNIHLSNVCKSHPPVEEIEATIEDSAGSVLLNIQGDLNTGTVTCLMGDNGAGKSSLLRIIAGLDPSSSGTVALKRQTTRVSAGRTLLSNSTINRRLIGYCPQESVLFDTLSVREQVLLFSEIVQIYNISNSVNYNMDAECDKLINLLGLKAHYEKKVSILSGGMKRRLSLVLASIGNPIALCLDEVTSGCDNITRDLVRTYIIMAKLNSVVILTTHHEDDAQILCDNLWYLEEKKLVFNGPLNTRVLRGSNTHLTDAYGHGDVSFSTADEQSKNVLCSQLMRHNGGLWKNNSLIQKLKLDNFRLNQTYSVTFSKSQWSILLDIMKTLEELDNYRWNIQSVNTLSALIDSVSKSTDPTYSEGLYADDTQEFNEPRATESNINSDLWNLSIFMSSISISIRHIKAILYLRIVEVLRNKMFFLITHILVPFAMVFSIVFYCGGHSYQKLDLSSGGAALQSKGEIYAGFNTIPNSNFVLNPLHNDKINSGICEDERLLSLLFPDSITWISGSIDSDLMEQKLNQEFYNHSRQRYCALVIDDIATDHYSQSRNHPEYKNSSRYYKPDNMGNTSDMRIKGTSTLNSNITMVINMTSYHSLPIFLKETIPTVLAVTQISPSISESASENYTTGGFLNTSLLLPPPYHIYSYPFESIDILNPDVLRRGNVGAVFVCLYMIINSATTVRFIVSVRARGTKHQLQLSGLRLSSYYIGNYIFDVAALIAIFTFIFIAIYTGGSPVMNYYFDSSAIPGMVFAEIIIPFSFAIVAANYAFCLFSDDELICQLSCLGSSVLIGFCIKLFFDVQKNTQFSWISSILMFVSPSYAFSTSIFLLFSHYGQSLLDTATISILLDDFKTNIRNNVCIMLLQACFYLTGAIFLDSYCHHVDYAIKLSRLWVSFLDMFKLKLWNSAVSANNSEQNVITENAPLLIHETNNSASVTRPNLNYEGVRLNSDASSAESNTIVKVVNVSVDYTSSSSHNSNNDYGAPALNDVSLSFNFGEKCALLGRNGSGSFTVYVLYISMYLSDCMCMYVCMYVYMYVHN